MCVCLWKVRACVHERNNGLNQNCLKTINELEWTYFKEFFMFVLLLVHSPSLVFGFLLEFLSNPPLFLFLSSLSLSISRTCSLISCTRLFGTRNEYPRMVYMPIFILMHMSGVMGNATHNGWIENHIFLPYLVTNPNWLAYM